MIPRDFIQTLLSRVDIVDVIQHYLPLRKAGANFMARCPFHNEKSPSFSVSPTKQFYYCFGCGASGNALGFVMNHSGVGFVEAVETLAEQVGMTVPRDTAAPHGAPDVSERTALLEILSRARDFFRERLKHNPRAIDYLKSRGLDGATAAHFQLGYAPDAWHDLIGHCRPDELALLVKAGLAIENEAGRHYDRFRDRIMFPIQDVRGQVVGFGGRIIDQGEPKYLNSPETALFEKGRELYGWTQARQAIREQGRILVVEGYMDVAALSQAGIGYALATLGTATTAVQAQRLLRATDELVFAFDGDSAGRAAAARALRTILPLLVDDKRVSFLFFPEGEDPDSFVRSRGVAALEILLREALPLSAFFLEQLFEGSTGGRNPEDQARLFHRAREGLRPVSAPALAMLLRRAIIARIGASGPEWERFLGGGATPRPTSSPARRSGREPPSTLAARLLACVLLDPSLVVRCGSPVDDLGSQDGTALLSIADFIRHAEGEVSLALVLEQFRGRPEEIFIQEALRREFSALEGCPTDELEVVYREGLGRCEHLARDRAAKALMATARERALTPEEQVRLNGLLCRPQ